MSRSKTTVVNQALGHLAKDAVTGDIEPANELAAQVALQYYDDTIRSALRFLRPNFAKKQAMIGADAEAPEFKWANRYPLPADFVALVSIGEDGILALQDEIDIMGKHLYCNETGSLAITYISSDALSDPNIWDDLFLDNVTVALAIKMGPQLGASSTRIDELRAILSDTEIRQAGIDGQEVRTRRYQSSKFINARRRWSSRSVERFK